MLTKKYALQMANKTVQILMRQAKDDAGEARHLQKTLRPMYRENDDSLEAVRRPLQHKRNKHSADVKQKRMKPTSLRHRMSGLRP